MEMSPIPKPTEADRDRFAELLPSDPDVTRRPMFGNLAGFVNGNMFMSLFGQAIALRLDPEARAELIALGGTEFAPMPGRPMKDYAVLPDFTRTDLDTAAAWVARSVEFTRTLPAKEPKKRAARK
jgi:TfoX/Sxy family transcriptional regulator of competence genes